MHRTVGVLAIVAVLGACGATDWKTSELSATKPPAVTARLAAKAAAARSAAERPYVDAMVASAHVDDPAANPTSIRCAFAALVHGYGPAAFAAAGLTPAALRAPSSTLDALAEPSNAQITSIGAAIQHCRVGSLQAVPLAQGLRLDDNVATGCIASRFDTDPAARRLLVFAWLNREFDLPAARGITDVVAACVDLPSYTLDAAHVDLDPATKACVLDKLQSSEAQIKELMAEAITGAQPDAVQYQEALAVSVNQCRPSAHTGFTVPSG